jgi:hypothetical protein
MHLIRNRERLSIIRNFFQRNRMLRTRGPPYLRSENWARPGLWGLRVGNRPVLPGKDTNKNTKFQPKVREFRGGPLSFIRNSGIYRAYTVPYFLINTLAHALVGGSVVNIISLRNMSHSNGTQKAGTTPPL